MLTLTSSPSRCARGAASSAASRHDHPSVRGPAGERLEIGAALCLELGLEMVALGDDHGAESRLGPDAADQLAVLQRPRRRHLPQLAVLAQVHRHAADADLSGAPRLQVVRGREFGVTAQLEALLLGLLVDEECAASPYGLVDDAAALDRGDERLGSR